MTVKRPLPIDDTESGIQVICGRVAHRLSNTLASFEREVNATIFEELDRYMREESTMDDVEPAADEHDGLDDVLSTAASSSDIGTQPPMKLRRLKDALSSRSTVRNATNSTIVKRSKDGSMDTMIEADKKDKLLLCDNSIILFVGEANEVVRSDVTNSLILAQLNADRQMVAFKQRIGSAPFMIDCLREWFRVFQETFQHMNWVDTGYQVEQAAIEGNALTIEKILLDIIESIGNEEEKSKFKKALSVLKSLPSDDDRMTLFSRRSAERDMSQFLVHIVYIDGRGSATMKSSMIGISTKETVTNALWFEWRDGGTRVYKAEHTMMLGSHAFDRMRPVIAAKIQQINETYVNQIPF